MNIYNVNQWKIVIRGTDVKSYSLIFIINLSGCHTSRLMHKMKIDFNEFTVFQVICFFSDLLPNLGWGFFPSSMTALLINTSVSMMPHRQRWWQSF